MRQAAGRSSTDRQGRKSYMNVCACGMTVTASGRAVGGRGVGGKSAGLRSGERRGRWASSNTGRDLSCFWEVARGPQRPAEPPSVQGAPAELPPCCASLACLLGLARLLCGAAAPRSKCASWTLQQLPNLAQKVDSRAIPSTPRALLTSTPPRRSTGLPAPNPARSRRPQTGWEPARSQIVRAGFLGSSSAPRPASLWPTQWLS